MSKPTYEQLQAQVKLLEERAAEQEDALRKREREWRTIWEARLAEVEAERDRLIERILRVAEATVARQAQVLREDASGRPVSELLRVAASMLNESGGGPVADCLALKADELDALGPEALAAEPQAEQSWHGEFWHAYCACGWECWEQPNEAAARALHEKHGLLATCAREVSYAARKPCNFCGAWIYPRRPVDGGPLAFPPECPECGAVDAPKETT